MNNNRLSLMFFIFIVVLLFFPNNSRSASLSNCSGPPSYTGNSGCLIRETFEGCSSDCTNCTSGISWSIYSGSPNCANTTAPLQGLQSFGGTSDATVIEILTSQVGTTYPSLYGAFMYKVESCSTAYPVPFGFSNSSGSDVAYISHSGSCGFRVCDGTSCTSSSTLTQGQLYYVKLYSAKGSGSNAIAQWWYSSNGTDWTDGGSITNGSNTLNIGRPWIFQRADTIYIDDVRVSTSDISYGATSFTITPSVVSGNGAILPSSAEVVSGDGNSSTYTATPSSGYVISSWGGTCGATGTASTYQKTNVTADCTITVTFDKKYVLNWRQ